MPVFLQRVTEYDVPRIETAFDGGLDQLGIETSGKKTAVIKVNIVQPRAPETGVVTHPAVVEAIIDSLRKRGIEDITIAEGPALGVDVQKAFDVSGFCDLAKRKRVKLLDLFKAPRTNVDVGFGYKDLPNTYADEDLPKYYCGSLPIPTICLESDLYISVPKLKTHNRTHVSLSLKHQWGLLPFRERQTYHQVGLHEPIAHLARAVQPHVVVIDGILGLEGNGPVQGSPKKSEVLIIGDNLLESDIVGAQLMKQPVRDIIHFQRAVELGIGTWDTHVLGASVDELAQEFVSAPQGLKKKLNFYVWRNHRACHLDDESFIEAFKIAKRTPKYWFTFIPKFAYLVLAKRLDVVKGRGAKLPDVNGGKVLLSGECVRELFENMEEAQANVVFVPGCPPAPEDIIKAIIRM